jgi:hypothetical protein
MKKGSRGWKRPVAERTRSKREWEPSRRQGPRVTTRVVEEDPGAENGASLGYKVADEQFNRGKMRAQRRDIPGAGTDLFGMGAFGGLSPDTFLGLSERWMRDAMMWFEYVAKASGSSRGAQPAPVSQENGALHSRGFAVEVSSALPVELTFAPHEGAELRPLAVHDLRATDRDFPGISGAEVAFVEGGWRISVAVDPKQPVGLYTGIVFDREDGEIRGTLALKVKKR